ncbi:hypothetical protein PS682_02846 [Pseudomonas fluorescens]|uniref:Uncharacterized protein n=1 Tax=Pseudomonas fluorescens TaxID=294 RepID=A0A5E6N042_PSEFL|nr:hypothetical protein PS683_05403 [Pseudomonas fluorescens]VVM82628.1 hypothetical protein PS663_02403 [Pseudomonas fluorescens]VVM90642.1 hypothetical protein PS682_02846 [Pseudomonas fluorescens]VVN40060.1 hypothetical protein PS683_05403 [Pseudomonas fluorescens]
MSRPDVRGGPDAWIIIQRRHPHNDVGLVPALSHQM